MTESASFPPSDLRQRLSIGVLGIGLLSLLAAVILLILTLSGRIGEAGNSEAGTLVAFGGPIDAALTPLATPTIPHPTPDPAAIAALVIPKFGVEAPIQIKGVDGNNEMISPDGPSNVAWYDFSAAPGNIGNSVYSGHVDYINYGPAVFYNIRNLVEGDTIEIRLQSGTVYKYAVSRAPRNFSANPTQEELADIVGVSEQEVITLITCGGTFSAATGEYDQRTVVRAERVLEPASARAR
jgi:LPXTG-site transpeptidase (sortase) family protein